MIREWEVATCVRWASEGDFTYAAVMYDALSMEERAEALQRLDWLDITGELVNKLVAELVNLGFTVGV